LNKKGLLNIKQENIMIFKNAFIIVFCLTKMDAFSQMDSTSLPIKIDTIYPINHSNEPEIISINPHTYPEYEGGVIAMRKFIDENLRFPNPNLYCGYTGTVYVGFIITKEGRIEDVKVKRGLGVAFNEEALRLYPFEQPHIFQ
jgi:Gram-negative bacterial TonB protein C-terminal